jgi:GNAT superfamily N-acetyltransferase
MTMAPKSIGSTTYVRLFARPTLLTRGGVWRRTARALLRRLHSDNSAYGLERDLTRSFQAPPAQMPLTIRPLTESDVESLLDLREHGISDDDLFQQIHQRELLATHLGTCFVAVVPDGRPCYMQWLIGADQTDEIEAVFHDQVPRLASDEVLLEGAFTAPAFRGRGVMANAMAQISELGRTMGARRAITFVLSDNVPSLKGCYRAGFAPYVIRRNHWHLFSCHSFFDTSLAAMALVLG